MGIFKGSVYKFLGGCNIGYYFVKNIRDVMVFGEEESFNLVEI